MAKNKLNPLRVDPTRTTMLRKEFMGDMGRRFNALATSIRRLVVDEDAFGLKRQQQLAGMATTVPKPATVRTLDTDMVINTRWAFETDDAKVADYRAWLKQQVDAGILEVSADNRKTPWLEPYIQSAYKKGMLRAYDDTTAMATAAAVEDWSFMQGGKKAFMDMAFGGPEAEAKLRLLATRAYSQLEGVTAQMDAEMSRILATGLASGSGPNEIAKQLTDSVDKLKRNRANTIARTETIHAHNEGQLDSFAAMNVQEVGVMAEWNTAHDGKVCALCRPLEGVVMTVDEARGLIPRHPNCRCAWLPADVGEVDGGTTKSVWLDGSSSGQVYAKDEVNFRLRESMKAEIPGVSAKEARAASTWQGADVKVSPKKKPKVGQAKAELEAMKKGAADKAAAERAAALAEAKRKAAKAKAAAEAAKAKAAAEKAAKELAEKSAKVTKGASDKAWEAMLQVPNDPTKAAKIDAAWAMFQEKAGWQKPAAGKTQSYGVLLFDTDGRILLRQPTGEFGGAKWTFAKGGGPHTAPATTALKELGEETGFKANIYSHLEDGYVGGSTKTNYFIGMQEGQQDPKLMDKETSAVQWFTYEEAVAAINQSPSAAVRARDLKILDDAYAKMGSMGNMNAAGEVGFDNIGDITNVGAQILKAAGQKEAKAATGYKVKLGMAKKHYSKPKFGGGVLDADYVNPERLAESGINKVLSEKGWHTTTLEADVLQELLAAPNVVEQKAIMDKLKKAPKGTPKPPTLGPVPRPAVAAPKPKGTGVFGPKQYHQDDDFYDVFLKAAKTVSVHAEDGNYNQSTLNAFDKAADKASMLLAGGGLDVDTEAMLVHYVQAADAINLAKQTKNKLPIGAVTKFEYQPEIKPLGADELMPVGKGFKPATYKVTATNLGGSTGAKKVRVKETGIGAKESDWILKDYSGRSQQAENEYFANGIYNLVNQGSAPESRLAMVRNRNGDTSVGVFNSFLENGTQIGDVAGSAKTMANRQAQDNFVMDAWLANWDAVGMGGDNMMVLPNGKVVRIDNGGALLYRAQGGLKGDAFGSKVNELETLLDPKQNPNAAKVYKGVTQKRIADQIGELEYAVEQNGGIQAFLNKAGLENISDAATRNQLYDTLSSRFHYLQEYRDAILDLDRIPVSRRVARISEVQVKKVNTETVAVKSKANRELLEAAKKINTQDITDFTGSGYISINAKHLELIRKGEKGSNKVSKINKQISELPGYEGVVGRGQRGGVTAEMWRKWESGEWAQTWWTCPSSTSAKPNKVFGSDSTGVCYIVLTKGKRNAWVQRISQHESEHEALFMGDSVFRVVATASGEPVGGGGHTRLLVLEEMDYGEIPEEKQAAPPKFTTRQVWDAFTNDANRAEMTDYGDTSGKGVRDLLEGK